MDVIQAVNGGISSWCEELDSRRTEAQRAIENRADRREAHKRELHSIGVERRMTCDKLKDALLCEERQERERTAEAAARLERVYSLQHRVCDIKKKQKQLDKDVNSTMDLLVTEREELRSEENKYTQLTKQYRKMLGLRIHSSRAGTSWIFTNIDELDFSRAFTFELQWAAADKKYLALSSSPDCLMFATLVDDLNAGRSSLGGVVSRMREEFKAIVERERGGAFPTNR